MLLSLVISFACSSLSFVELVTDASTPVGVPVVVTVRNDVAFSIGFEQVDSQGNLAFDEVVAPESECVQQTSSTQPWRLSNATTGTQLLRVRFTKSGDTAAKTLLALAGAAFCSSHLPSPSTNQSRWTSNSDRAQRHLGLPASNMTTSKVAIVRDTRENVPTQGARRAHFCYPVVFGGITFCTSTNPIPMLPVMTPDAARVM